MAATTGDGEGEGLAAFVVPATADEGAELPIRSAVARIGQGPQNDVVLDDDTVSTNHAQIEYRDGSWLLTDLESTNGTYVNGTRLVPGVATAIPDGAMVAFGALKLRFRHGEVAAPTATPSAGTAEPTPQRRRAGFRLPVWLALLILLVIAVIVFLVITWTGGPAIPEPSASPTAALPAIYRPPGMVLSLTDHGELPAIESPPGVMVPQPDRAALSTIDSPPGMVLSLSERGALPMRDQGPGFA